MRFGASVQMIATSAKLLALLLLALVVFWFGDAGTGAWGAREVPGAVTWGGLGIAMIGVLFAYDGWSTLTGMAGEVRNPGRNLPLALVSGTIAVILVYVLVNAAYLYARPLEEVARSEIVAVDAATAVAGAAGASLIAALCCCRRLGR